MGPAIAAAAPVAAAALSPRTRRLLEGPVARTLLALAAPNVLVMVLQAAVSTLDAVFVGWLGSAALAGVSIVFPLVMLMQTMSAGGMGGGVASAVARALGGGRRADADALVIHAVVIALVMGGAFTLALELAGPALFHAMGGTRRGPRRRGHLRARALRRRRRLLALQHAEQRDPRQRQHGGARGDHGGDRDRLPGALPRPDPRLGPAAPPGHRGRGRRQRVLLRAGQRRAARVPLLEPEPGAARAAGPGAPARPLLGDPARRRPRLAQHRRDEPDRRGPDRAGRALRRDGAGRLRPGRAARVSPDPDRLRPRAPGSSPWSAPASARAIARVRCASPGSAPRWPRASPA